MPTQRRTRVQSPSGLSARRRTVCTYYFVKVKLHLIKQVSEKTQSTAISGNFAVLAKIYSIPSCVALNCTQNLIATSLHLKQRTSHLHLGIKPNVCI